jgi:hypothetical protein
MLISIISERRTRSALMIGIRGQRAHPCIRRAIIAVGLGPVNHLFLLILGEWTGSFPICGTLQLTRRASTQHAVKQELAAA